MALIRKQVYLGRDNTFAVTFTQVNEAGVESAVDFGAVHALRMLLVGSGVAEADYTTLTAGSTLDASLGGGALMFKLGGLVGLLPGVYPLRLASLTAPGDTHPTQLAHEHGDDVISIHVLDTADE